MADPSTLTTSTRRMLVLSICHAGLSSMAEVLPRKQGTGVRFPQPAPPALQKLQGKWQRACFSALAKVKDMAPVAHMVIP
jgi:hypothetical protein